MTRPQRTSNRRFWRTVGTAAISLLAAAMLTLAATPAAATAQNPAPGTPAGTAPGDAPALFTGLAGPPGPTPFSGAAATSIPIVPVPGRLGMQPELSLRYSSGAGRSAYGHGWDLPLARIERSRRHGVPRFRDDDALDLVSPNGLVELADEDGGGRRYGDRWGGPGLVVLRAASGWTVLDPDGRTLHFGSSPASRVGDARGTAVWLLDRIEDSTGNHIDFEYLPDEDPSSATSIARTLPLRIRYGGNLRSGLPHFASVEFRWTPTALPTTPAANWAGGFRQRRDLLLEAVETFAEGINLNELVPSHSRNKIFVSS